ncbi:MAG: hypothetical protein BGO55_21635 [Sphingobacteriales bacterium 50-39]|nr:TonB-dependent receptor [Sphingobacteriales bacterium]OJW59592.1 MAG: hypothetical protein BGO55_21635 [Sphingobacteriales bacterium 50-39]
MKKLLLFLSSRLLLAGIILSLAVTGAYAADGYIKGHITDKSGNPLATVSVKVKNSTRGTSTDANGDFSLVVPDGAVLEISAVGFRPQEIPVHGRTEFSIRLEEVAAGLNEVVVVGYGTQKKKDVVGAVASVDTKNMEKLTGGNVANLLQGQAAGVNVAPGSGDPGAAPVVLIRGLSTIGNTDPLYVIDGIPGDINALNPNDIQSIDILKDASAATIYGSRASNGVIMVTTRRGKEGKIHVGVNSYYGVASLAKRLPLTNRAQYDTIMNHIAINDGSTPLDFASSSTYVDNHGVTRQYPNTDWQSAFFRDAPESKVDLTVSGGSKDIKMNVSLGHYDQQGIVLHSGVKKNYLQVNTDLTKDKLKFGESFTISQSTRDLLNGSDETRANNLNADYPLIYEMINRVPQHPLYDTSNDGGFGGRIGLQMTDAVNPVGYQTLVKNVSQSTYLMGNVYAEYQLLPPLSVKVQYGLNVTDGYGYTHIPTYYMGAKVQNSNAQLYESRDRSWHDVLNAVATFNKTFGSSHTVNAIAGYSQERSEYRSLSGGNNALPSNDLWSLYAGTGNQTSSGSINQSSLRSVFGRVNYSYEGKYLLAASVRRDGSSRFSGVNKYGTFYSFSGGWRISEENFFSHLHETISDLKLRASYGILGNQSIPDYLYLPPPLTIGNRVVNYPFGPGLRQGIAIGAIITNASSPDIKWEQSKTMNFGVDVSILKDKITLTADYFRTTTTDMLVELPLPPSSGLLSNPLRNGGEMQNQGVDLSLSYRGNAGEWKYTLTTNISVSRNKIKRLGYADESYTDGYLDYNNFPTTLTKVGGEIGRFYLYKTNGVIKTQKDLDEVKAYQPNAQLGDVKFVDVNKDGILNDDDRVFMGSGLPKMEYGLTGNVSYRNWDLNFFFQGTLGNKIYDGARRLTWQTTIFNKSTDLLNAWSPSNPNSNIPRVTILDPNQTMSLPSDLFLENGSYLRLKSLQLGYRFKLRNINTLRIYAGGSNLLTVTGYKGFDPGVVNYSPFARGVDRGLYPLSRSVFAGVNFDF